MMRNAYCSACGTEVRVDDSGRCDQGHLVQPPEATELGIELGTKPELSDEPQPWVAPVAGTVAAADEEELPAAPAVQEPPPAAHEPARPPVELATELGGTAAKDEFGDFDLEDLEQAVAELGFADDETLSETLPPPPSQPAAPAATKREEAVESDAPEPEERAEPPPPQPAPGAPAATPSPTMFTARGGKGGGKRRRFGR